MPRAVHGLADGLIRRSRGGRRRYTCRGRRTGAGRGSRAAAYKSPEYAILNTATEHLERGKTVMFLAACSYMLQPLIAVLRKHGIPFHNPYRKIQRLLEPAAHGKPGSTASRILSLLVAHPDYGAGHRPWTHGDLALWAEWLQAKGVLRHGVKKTLSRLRSAAAGDHGAPRRDLRDRRARSLMAAWDGGYRASAGLVAVARHRRRASARVQFPAISPPGAGRSALRRRRRSWSGPSTPSKAARPMWSIFSRI